MAAEQVLVAGFDPFTGGMHICHPLQQLHMLLIHRGKS